ncbi:hypothetical protein SAMN03159391_00517 [Pseudomonas sp. NFACC37-1]|nr:hypothetical protein SAMN03159391_00517 [Pseudomonas sp. NFACC37-1]
MFDGAVRQAPRLSGDAQFSGLLRRAVAIFLANRYLWWLCEGSADCIKVGLFAGDLVQLPPSAKQPSKPIKSGRGPKPVAQDNSLQPQTLCRESTSLLRANVGKFLKASASVLSTVGSRLTSMRPERSIRHCICSNTVSRNNEENSTRLIAANISSATRLNTFHITPKRLRNLASLLTHASESAGLCPLPQASIVYLPLPISGRV